MSNPQKTSVGARRAARKFTAEQRQQIVAESRQPGMTVRAVAQRHQIGASLLSLWRQREAQVRQFNRSGFAAVRVSAPALSATGVIEIDLDQRCVRVRGRVDAQMLREALAAAR